MVVLSSIKIDMNFWSIRDAKSALKELGIKTGSTNFEENICYYNQKDVDLLRTKGYIFDSESKITDGIFAVFYINKENDDNEPSKRAIMQQIKSGSYTTGRCKSPSRSKSMKSPRKQTSKSLKSPRKRQDNSYEM